MIGEHMMKLTSVLMGEETLLVQCAEILLERGHAIAAIVSNSESIRSWGAQHGVELLAPNKDYAYALSQLNYDWFFSAANLRMVPTSVWQGARHGAANFHDGPLPRYAGLNAPSWALLAGETRYGVTWHRMTEVADEGDILAQLEFEIDRYETALTLNTKCFEAGIDSFLTLIQHIESGSLSGRPQDLALRTYYPKFKLPEAAGTLCFDRTTAEVERLFRALDYGQGYANPLALPKLRTDGRAYGVRTLEAQQGASGRPGEVLDVSADAALVATADGVVRIGGLVDEFGEVVALSVLTRGQILPPLGAADAAAIDELAGGVARSDQFLLDRWRAIEDLDLPWLDRSDRPQPRSVTVEALDQAAAPATVAAAFVSFLARVSGQDGFGLAYGNAALARRAAQFPGYVAPIMPMRATITEIDSAEAIEARLDGELTALRGRLGQSGDLVARSPAVKPARPAIGLFEGALADLAGFDQVAIVLVLTPEGAFHLVCDRARIGEVGLASLLSGLSAYLAAFAADRTASIIGLPLLGDAERQIVLEAHNHTQRDYERDRCIHQLIEQAVDRTPEATALVCDGDAITYAELDRRANQVAHALVAAGVKPGSLVGLNLPRSLALVIGAYGIHKAGAAYVPLDPAYPADRTTMMAQDSGLAAIILNQDTAATLLRCDAHPLDIDMVIGGAQPTTRLDLLVPSSELAYVIYTSGSTGRPKGVMIEHRNVANFFAGMDDTVPCDGLAQPVWLAVTSLSFDISVLELFWTLSRGFKVILNGDAARRKPALSRRAAGGMDISLFYWGNDDGPGPLKYQLLLEGARFADGHGFRAVWTPERHFHAFGGPYPNPAVTGAAVAAVTQNIDVRAGSCVLPLHHPARIAEEWAVVDNLSGGRAGLAFASGWMPEDFVLRPENRPPNNKAAMIRDIEVVRKLWRGEAIAFEMADGKLVDIVTQPRPVQKELPVWVTTAGNPETYREAARLGANVLTHLLGQSINELAEKINIYRNTLKECGRNPDDYTVTLMLHTLIGDDRERVRDLARAPMKAYLRSAAALIKQYAWAFPAFKKPQGVNTPLDIDLQSLDPEEMDAILEFAFLRYFEDSGLFGTVDDALARIDVVKAIGVNEIACLIDYGVAPNLVLDGLTQLAEVVSRCSSTDPTLVNEDFDIGLGALIRRHSVTHMQATPSMMTMIMMNENDRNALSAVKHLFIGGEALQSSLLRQIRQITEASIDNMYGPTETTIWSSTHRVHLGASTESVAPLGQPIANTQLYVLDRYKQPVPVGCPGELYIGGDGVARGYLKKPELTAERFVVNPFVAGGRMYRTGDLVRRDASGTLNFLGRADHQVKVRGYRIELGEIESQLGKVDGVQEAVVIAREDEPNDVRLVAYIRFAKDAVPDTRLRQQLAASLPDFMIPSHFVAMENFPLTPNAKVDRKALPRPNQASVRPVSSATPAAAPSGNLEQGISEAFKRFLGLERVSPTDNFFNLGGHSLLAVQMHRHLKATLVPSLTITDLFRFPTVNGLAAHLQGASKESDQLERVADRAAMRRKAMNRGSAPV